MTRCFRYDSCERAKKTCNHSNCPVLADAYDTRSGSIAPAAEPKDMEKIQWVEMLELERSAHAESVVMEQSQAVVRMRCGVKLQCKHTYTPSDSSEAIIISSSRARDLNLPLELVMLTVHVHATPKAAMKFPLSLPRNTYPLPRTESAILDVYEDNTQHCARRPRDWGLSSSTEYQSSRTLLMDLNSEFDSPM